MIRPPIAYQRILHLRYIFYHFFFPLAKSGEGGGGVADCILHPRVLSSRRELSAKEAGIRKIINLFSSQGVQSAGVVPPADEGGRPVNTNVM